MLKRLLIFSAIVLVVSQVAVASDRDDDVARTQKAAQVFKEIMNTPDQGIPHDLLHKAKCIAIIPGDVKFAFIFGGNYGRGVATCRTEHGWSAPIFIAIDGGSVGYQIGGSSTDLIMLFMNSHALHSLLADKFKLGADASVAAGPVGREATASTDLELKAAKACLLESASMAQSYRRTKVAIRLSMDPMWIGTRSWTAGSAFRLRRRVLYMNLTHTTDRASHNASSRTELRASLVRIYESICS
jgi:lipid-binding SYLF domain-containing protein